MRQYLGVTRALSASSLPRKAGNGEVGTVAGVLFAATGVRGGRCGGWERCGGGLDSESSPGVRVGWMMTAGGADGCRRWLWVECSVENGICVGFCTSNIDERNGGREEGGGRGGRGGQEL